MATEVLRPQDILIERFRVPPSPFHRRRSNFPNGKNYINPRLSSNNRKHVVRTTERTEKKRLNNPPEPPRRSASADDLRPVDGRSNSGLVMGRVTILRRGESFDSLNSIVGKDNNDNKTSRWKKKLVTCDDLTVYETVKMEPGQIRVGLSSPDVYAGSAFSNSPSPRSLPFPSFFNKKHEEFKSFDDYATRDLRRLLRLEN